ncbi:MAG: DUF3810 domain-containing protein [Planctomycetota bacterium]
MPASAEPESRCRGPVLTLLGATALAAAAHLWLPRHPEWVESFYRPRVYGAVRASVHRVCALAPFSVAQGLVVLLVLGLLCAGFRHLRRSGVRALPGLLLRALRSAAVLYALYLVLWGALAWRPTLAQRWGFEGGQEDLMGLADELTAALLADRPGLDREGFSAWGADGRPTAAIRQALERAGALQPEFAGPVPALRRFATPRLWARFGISGIFVPFTGEPHVNAEAPAVRQPFHALHEIAHARGIVREDEANFVAWWIAVHSGDPHLRYAANLVAWEHALVALSIVDTPAAKEMAGRLTPEIRADRKAVTEYWRQFEGPLEAVGRRTNDLFLKSQGQTHGVASYGRMLQLLLAERAHRLAPTPPPENVSRSGAGQGL